MASWRLFYHRPTQRWLQVLMTSSASTIPVPLDIHRAEVARGFGLLLADIDGYEGQGTPEECAAIHSALAGLSAPTVPGGPPATGVVAAAVTVRPDAAGFEEDLKTLLGSAAAVNALAKEYPLFGRSLDKKNWAYIQTWILDAKTRSLISQTLYDAIKAKAAARALPIVLP